MDGTISQYFVKLSIINCLYLPGTLYSNKRSIPKPSPVHCPKTALTNYICLRELFSCLGNLFVGEIFRLNYPTQSSRRTIRPRWLELWWVLSVCTPWWTIGWSCRTLKNVNKHKFSMQYIWLLKESHQFYHLYIAFLSNLQYIWWYKIYAEPEAIVKLTGNSSDPITVSSWINYRSSSLWVDLSSKEKNCENFLHCSLDILQGRIASTLLLGFIIAVIFTVKIGELIPLVVRTLCFLHFLRFWPAAAALIISLAENWNEWRWMVFGYRYPSNINAPLTYILLNDCHWLL